MLHISEMIEGLTDDIRQDLRALVQVEEDMRIMK